MGNLNDYFRATDDEAASEARDREAGPLSPGDDGNPAFDGVDAKGIDAAVILGRLCALAAHIAWSVGLVSEGLVAPSLHDSDALESGPWVTRLSDRARDILAEIKDANSHELAEQWARIEEFGGHADRASLRAIVIGLSALAVRARASNQHLYCWSSL